MKSNKSAQVESLRRRQEAQRLRAQQAALRATFELMSTPRAWLAQGGEVLLFILYLMSVYWAMSSGILLLWCLATSMPVSEVPLEGKRAAASVVYMLLTVRVLLWLYNLELPIKSPFLSTWRETYSSTHESYARRRRL